MATKRLPYTQALKLVRWMDTFKEMSQLVGNAQRRLEALRSQLAGAAAFADIPLDRKDVQVRIEAGPDKKGMVTVEWEDVDASAQD